MEFNEQEVQDYLKQKFQGRDSFLENIIFPIFGEDHFEEGYDAELLNDPGVRHDAEKVGIRSIITYGRVGIDLGSVQIFDITVTDHVLLARNRVTVQGIIRRILGTFHGAFMIFHYADTQRWDWRFTFCCKGDKDITEAKRFTFLLGPNQSCRTAAQNFVKLAASASASASPTMDDIKRAFDVEALSNEFFAKYKTYYEGIVKYITGKCFKKIGGKWKEVSEGVPNEEIYAQFDHDDKAVRDYVKKMLGRIVFLHFLQKKGWLGAKKSWDDGDREFMLHLYNHASDRQKNDFLDAVLEPLFDRALDVDRSARGDVFDTGISGIGKVKIPYLNGGLFTRDAADEKAVRLPCEYFHNFLVFLSQYNFTIDENDPSDAEVGVDPEMLSRIFENLLEDNKDKGAIYTPKPIVEYMCRQSLIAYLQTDMPEAEHAAIEQFVKTYDPSGLSKKTASTIDRKLKSVKICDPAIGSGAFPMGMLRELYFCRTALEEDLGSNCPAEIKRQIIQENIYGVDIEKGAVDIARLRFWLALVVDEPTPHTLPNLDFKIMQGNSLLENYKGVPLDSLLSGKTVMPKKAKQGRFAFDKRETYSQGELAFGGQMASDVITSLMKEYYATDNRDRKQRILDDINAQVKGYIKDQINNSDLHAEIDALECQNDKFFLWHTWFADVFAKGGFDIVIGNPPYIKEYINKSAFDGFRETSPYYMGKMDLWYGFACHGIDMLSHHGILCFIAQNNWTTSAGAKKMRAKVASDTRILQMIDFNDYMVFGEGNTEGSQIQTMIMMFQRDAETDDYVLDHRCLTIGADSQLMYLMLGKVNTPLAVYSSPRVNRKKCKDKPLVFSGDGHVLDVISLGKVYLTEKEIIQGIVPALDDYFLLQTKDGFSDSECQYIKEFYTGLKDRYVAGQIEKYLIYMSAKNFKGTDLSMFPNLERHFAPHKEELSEAKIKYGTPHKPYFFVHRERDESFFVKGNEKIISQIRCDRPRFCYTTKPFYGSRALFYIRTGRWSMKFLTGVLNSWLIAYWLRHKGKMQGALYQVDKGPLLSIPLPPPESCDQKPIIALVDQILAAKKTDPNADTSALESKIDQLVYKLYGLTDDEIAIVEGRNETKQEPQGETARRPAASPRRRRQVTTPASPEPANDEVLE